MAQFRTHNFWFLIRKVDEVPGEWVAHCLELDVVSQGRSIDHAIRMLFEATMMVLVDDIEHGRDLSERRAPEAFWDELWQVLREGEPIDAARLADLNDKVGTVAGQVVLHLVHQQQSTQERAAVEHEVEDMPRLPALWKQPMRSSQPRDSHPRM